MKKIFSFLASFLPALTLCAVPFIAEQPVIDGDLSEPVWRKIPWRSSFTLIGTKEPAAAQTRFKTYNNGDYLFFAVECDEPDTARLVRKPYSDGSGLVWMNDSVEISLVPDSRVLSFYKIIADSNGASTDFFGQDDNTDQEKYLFSSAWKSGAAVKTRITSGKWTLEAAIPFGAMNFVPANSDKWRINVARNRWSVQPAELSSWSQLPYKSHVIPKAFGMVTVGSFNAAEHLYDIENFKGEIRRSGDTQSYQVSATVHNNMQSFRIFRQLCTLADLKTGKKTSSESVIRLPRHSYQAFSVSIPQVENGHYLFTWDLFSNKRSPVLQKRMTREVTVEYIPLHVTLLRPAYRNNLYATMPDKTIEAQIELREDIGIPLIVELTGENVREVRKIARSGGKDRVLFDGAKLADGRYTLKVRCEKNGRELAASVKIRKLPYRKGEVWLDARGVTHVDGVPFLPYGWYGTHGKRKACYNSFLNTARYARMSDAVEAVRSRYEDFGLRSLIVPFQDLGGWNDWRWVVFKDPETRRKGLTPEQRKKIIEFVSEAGKLDGVLGWYMADEPECRDNNPVWYEEARELIAEIDPYHPCFMLNWGTGGMRRYYKGCDILLPDCYPQYFEDGTTSKNRWEPSEYAKVSTSLRPAWQMPLMTSWPALSRDGKTRGIPPTYHDQRSQIFQAVVHNVKGFNLYAWFDSQRFSSLILGPPAIGKTLMLLRDYMLENSVPGGVQTETIPVHPHFQAGLKIHDGKLCLIAVNTSMNKIKATFRLKNRFSGKLYLEGGTAAVQVNNGIFTDAFTPNETRIYCSDKELASRLPAVADTVAAINAHRAARKKTGNLAGQGEMLDIEYTLYGEQGKLAPGVPKITASSDARFYMTSKTGSLYYLIDGLTETERPEYSWKPSAMDKNPWVEFKLSHSSPLHLVKLHTPSGNLKTGKIRIGGRLYPFDNSSGKTEIRIPLDGIEADTVRIECGRFNTAGEGIAGRLLTEVEIFGTSSGRTSP